MSARCTRSLVTLTSLLALGLTSLAAQAQTLRVRCDVFHDRSRASVDGSDLAAGQYSAMLTSGPNTAQSPQEAAVAGEVQFDFDSNKKDVRQGATKIGKHFIVDGSATGTLLDADGNVVATKTRNCKMH